MPLTNDPARMKTRRGRYYQCEACGSTDNYASPGEPDRRYCSKSCQKNAGMVKRGEMTKERARATKVSRGVKSNPGLRRTVFDFSALLAVTMGGPVRPKMEGARVYTCEDE